MPRPYIGRTRNIRISEEVWAKAHTMADERGTTATQIVRDLLTRWVEGQIQVPVTGITRHRLECIALASEVSFEEAAQTSLQIGARGV